MIWRKRPRRAPAPRLPAPRRDQVAADGQTVTLGDESIKLFITAGHTPASLSMLIPVKDKGQGADASLSGRHHQQESHPSMHTAYDQWTTQAHFRSARRQSRMASSVITPPMTRPPPRSTNSGSCRTSPTPSSPGRRTASVSARSEGVQSQQCRDRACPGQMKAAGRESCRFSQVFALCGGPG